MSGGTGGSWNGPALGQGDSSAGAYSKADAIGLRKTYDKRGKTDAADADAICEAAARPTMHFVAINTVDQQAALMLHKTRDLLVRQRTMLINGLRGHLAEFGVIAAKGPSGLKAAIEALHEAQEHSPEVARLELH